MDERFVKKLLIPSFIIVVLSVIFVYEFKHLLDYFVFKEKKMLIIGILSAPENFKQRISLRETWLKLVSGISASSYFIIGNEICEVPVIDRPDPYTCTSRPFSLTSDVTEETEFTTIKISNNSKVYTPIPFYTGFGFYVRSPINITKLGILKELLVRFKCNVTVNLFSAFNSNLLATVTFNKKHLSNKNSPILLQSIKPVSLEEFSEVNLKIEAENLDSLLLPNCQNAQWENGPNVITFNNLWHSSSVIPDFFKKKSCTYVLMAYRVLDTQKIKTLIVNKKERYENWHLQNKKLNADLVNESKFYNDIIFVNTVDVYRNLSKKMIEFYKRIIKSVYFHYILKTDDDSFIDLLRVYHQLEIIRKNLNFEMKPTYYKNIEFSYSRLDTPKFWWWSHFREFWKVQRSGKWRDSQYRSASYPSFPCGGGYVVNKDIANYIATNAKYLNQFQGEDVSLGIWLSSLSVTQYRNPNINTFKLTNKLQKKIRVKFKDYQSKAQFKTKNSEDFVPDVCEWVCDNQQNLTLPSCNKVQLTINEMYNTWNKYKQKGFI